MYHYAGNNPVRYIDPDGRIIDIIWDIGFTLYDIGSAIYKSTKGDNSGWIDVGIDAAAILIPCVPAGLSKIDDAVKLAKKADKVGDAIRTADKTSDVAKTVDKIADGTKVVDKAKDNSKVFSKAKQDLVEMAKQDKKAGGMTKADFQAYKDLNNELPDPFTTTGKKPQIHGPEFHPNRGSVTSQQEHVHIGPVNHIPITD